MKRVFALLIGVAALTIAAGGGFGPSPALAGTSVGIDHDGGAPDINAGPAPVATGGEVTVSLVAEAGEAGLGAWTVDVHYDPAVLDPVGCVAHPSGLCNENLSVIEVRVVGADVPGLHGSVDLADITFEAVGTAGECSDLSPEVVTWTDSNGVDQGVAVLDGSICVVEPDSQLGIDHDGAPPDINAGPLNIPAGDTGAISVVAETPPEGLGAWTVDIHYDPAVLQPLSCVTNPAAAGACNMAFSVIEVRFAGATAAGLFGTVNLADIEFRAVGAAGDCSDLVPEVVTWTDPTAAGHFVSTSNGRICVTEPCPDVTGDGSVTGRDVGDIAQHMRGDYDARYDVNGDGVIDRHDLGIAASHVGSLC